MPKKIKSKARLDKWYHIAKEQGYRSRAAFKLIQLNRKYNFLNSANTLVDLCAAPGGWLQVATRYMPVSSIKIGIDLDKIKSVPGCITFQEDITTPRCLALIKKEIKSEKVDVVLNDGAPNVGANWSKDAFSQVELVLAALKLAATVLRRGGTFVTKVFRSTDYNSLIWVLNKFFEKVEATKPAASRTQSAEIFIVCLRFIAPDYIDPKLFDTKFVFKDTEEDLLKESEAEKITSIDKLLADQKKKHRTGYDADAPVTLHKTISFEDFLHIENPLVAFAKYNRISFTPEDEAKYLPLAKTPEDYKEVIEDLKVIGKRELQSLLKWRNKVLTKLGRQAKKAGKTPEGIEEEEKEGNADAAGHDTDSELEEEIKKEKVRELKELKRQKGKKLEQLAKLGERAPGTVIADAEELNFDFTKSKRNIEKIGYVDVDDEEEELAPIEKKKHIDAKEVEDNLELIYELTKKKAAKQESNRIRKIEEKQRKKLGEDFDEEQFRLEVIQEQKQMEVEEESHKIRKDRNVVDDVDEDEEDESDFEEEVNGAEEQNMGAVAEKYLTKSKWFDRDIFKQGIKAEELESISKSKNPLKLAKRKDNKKEAEGEVEAEAEAEAEPKKKDDIEEEGAEEDFEDVEDEEEETAKSKKKKKAEKLKVTSSMAGKEKRRRKIKADSLAGLDGMEEEKDNGKIEIVPALRYDDYDVDSLAQMRVLAGKMLRKKDREEIIEDSYNRYSRPVDEDAPDWFLEDENKHNYKILPITKEEFAAEKARLLAIKNKPIKKIVEAKIRRKFQVAKKLKKAESRAKDIMEQEGVSEVSKLKQVKGLYRKALKNKKIEKKYVVARKGGNSKIVGSGTKTKLVDSRMKKEKRADKRLAKQGRGRLMNGKQGAKGGAAGGRVKRKGSKKRQIKRH